MPGAVPTSILREERSPGIQPLAAEVSVYGIMQSVISPAAKYPAIQPTNASSSWGGGGIGASWASLYVTGGAITDNTTSGIGGGIRAEDRKHCLGNWWDHIWQPMVLWKK